MYLDNKSKKKKRLPRRAIILLVVVLIVIAVLTVGLVMLLSRGREVEETMTPLPYTSSDTYFAVGDNIIYAKDSQLTCINTSLSTVWKLIIDSSAHSFESRDGNIAIIGDNFVQVIDENNSLLCSTQTEGSIQSVRVCANKFAMHIDRIVDEETYSYIVVFDMNANNIYEIDITDRHMLDYGFDEQSDQLYILELDATGTTPVSRISTYRPETQSMTSIKEIKDQLISKLFLLEEGLYTVGTNQLTFYQDSTDEESSTMIYGWILEDTYLGDDPKFICISSSTTDDIDTVRIIKASGGETTINLPPGVFRVLHTDERIYGFAPSSIFVYTIEGEYMRTHTIPIEIDSVEKAMDYYVFITVGETVYLLPLP